MFKRIVVLVAAVLGLVAASAMAGRAVTFEWRHDPSAGRIYTDVEHQHGVVNPTGCAWDPDDTIRWLGSGDIDHGQVVSKTLCIVADSQAHLSGTRVTAASSATLDVRISFVPHGRFWSLAERFYPANTSKWEGCVIGPEYDANQQPLLPLVPDSNGGHGVLTDVTVSVRNTGAKRARSVATDFWVTARWLPNGLCIDPIVRDIVSGVVWRFGV